MLKVAIHLLLQERVNEEREDAMISSGRKKRFTLFKQKLHTKPSFFALRIVFITLSLHYHYHHVSVYLFTSGASHIFIDNLLYHSTARALFSASVGS